MKKVLVACAYYPRENSTSMQYVHVRNKYYQNHDIDVKVLSFSANESYIYEGIQVLSLNDVQECIKSFSESLLICHAPNLRNHYRFIRNNKEYFKNIMFFFHGHEIVEEYKTYPKPYLYVKKSIPNLIIKILYDKFKLAVWHNYFKKKDRHCYLVFVSRFLEREFTQNLKIEYACIKNRSEVINNSVGDIFQNTKYDVTCEKIYDYITIRSNLDSSVYCIDLVYALAKENPSKKFLIIGKGNFFKHNEKLQNITLINKQLKQDALIDYIDKSKCALMPTRRDSQGVMSCELATFGIPLITSNLDVCEEMFSSFKNVSLIDNKELSKFISEVTDKENINCEENRKFYFENTVQREVDIINTIMSGVNNVG